MNCKFRSQREERKELGRISDMQEHIRRFRALDLDPRRAEAKAEEEAEAARVVTKKTELLLSELDRLPFAKLEDFAWKHIKEGSVEFQADWATKFQTFTWSEDSENVSLRGALIQRLGGSSGTENPDLKGGLDFLINDGDSRRGCGYSSEEEQAQHWIGKRLNSAVEAIVIGSPFGRQPAIELLGLAKDENALPIFSKVLEKVPSEGGFETQMTFDDFVAAIAIAIQRIDKPRRCRDAIALCPLICGHQLP